MAVMTAGVHDTGVLARVIHTGLLTDRKRIYIRTQSKTFGAVALSQNADDTRTTKPLRDLITTSSEAFSDQRACTLLVEGKFRKPV